MFLGSLRSLASLGSLGSPGSLLESLETAVDKDRCTLGPWRLDGKDVVSRRLQQTVRHNDAQVTRGPQGPQGF